MKKCSVCNNVVDDNMNFCPNCGNNYFVYDNNYNYNYNYQNNIQPQSNLGNPIIWGILGYFVPLAGIILFFVWKSTNPKHGNAAGIGALINIGLSIVVVIFYLIFLFGVIGMSSY